MCLVALTEAGSWPLTLATSCKEAAVSRSLSHPISTRGHKSEKFHLDHFLVESKVPGAGARISLVGSGLGDAVDVKATDGVQEAEERGSEFTPKHQGEADERDLIPEEDHKTQEPPRGQDERGQEKEGIKSPLAPRVDVLTHLGHHEELKAKDGGYHSHGVCTASQAHAHSQPRHVGLTQVSEAVWLALVGNGAELPQSKEAVLSQKPVPITDGDGREDHSQGGTGDDESPDERLEEGPVGPPLAQQPLGLEYNTGSSKSATPHATPSLNSPGNTLNQATHFPQHPFSPLVS